MKAHLHRTGDGSLRRKLCAGQGKESLTKGIGFAIDPKGVNFCQLCC